MLSQFNPKGCVLVSSETEWRPLLVNRSNAPSSFLQVMNQVEGQQKSLVQSIESLPMRGSLSCLDQDLLLLKATSAATLSCLGECLNILQQSAGHNHGPPSGESNTDTLQMPVPPPDPEPAKDQGEVDCGPCPYLTGPMQLNVCNNCC